MSSTTKFWNGKISGFPGFFFSFISGTFRWISRRISTFVYRHNFASCGKNCLFGIGDIFQYPGKISLGNNVSIADNVVFSSNNTDGFCKVKDGVIINNFCQIDYSGGIEFGTDCCLSEMVLIETHSHGYDPHSPPQASPLVIEDNVWIGTRAVILPQVARIGRGSIIAAGAIVTHSVPPNVVFGGNPARVIKHINQSADS